VRVIAGHAHGRKLKAPRGLKTRPASARARQSIFSRLETALDFEVLRVLDLFAGSGSLGIEALSRGAAHATFVDSSRPATRTIRENLGELGLGERARVLTADVLRALSALALENQRFGLVFVDPPYARDISATVLYALAEGGLVEPGGWVVVRQSRRAPAPPEGPVALPQFKVAVIGDHRIAFYRRPNNGAEEN
jgi:16S rRNA (guanine966-N2)-methyltransferase